ncbi:MAG: hypothetical protein ABIW46_04475 [Acidimicrobiales bacterium]
MRLPIAGLVIGVWALLPPYSGPEINTATRVEVADHVVPAALLLGISLWALLAARRPSSGSGSAMLVAGFGVVLAGLWMTATHLPLVAQARRDQVTEAAAAYHTIPGLVVLALGAIWAARHWSAAAPDRPTA